MMAHKHSCPCCCQYEFPGKESYEIRPVFNWEDDPVQAEEPDYKGGANVLSLNEAREHSGKAERYVSSALMDLIRERMAGLNSALPFAC